MEVRRVNKYFYCHGCNSTFNRLINPSSTDHGICPYCNKSFIEVIDKPKPPTNFPTNHIQQPQIQPEPRPPPMQNYYQQQPVYESQNEYLPEHGYYQQPNYYPEQVYHGPHYSYSRGTHFPRRSHRYRRHSMPRAPCFFSSQFPFENIGNPFGMGYEGEYFEEEKMPLGFPEPFLPHTPVFTAFSFPPIFESFQPFFLPAENLGMREIMENFMSNFHPRFSQEYVVQPEEEVRRPPTSKKMLSSLKSFKLEEKNIKKSEDGKLEYPSCTICCSNISLGEKCVLLPCGHMYHNDCIKPWLKKNNTCPTCRYELPTDDPGYEGKRRRGSRRERGRRYRARR